MTERIKSKSVVADSSSQGTTHIFDSSDFEVPEEPLESVPAFPPAALVSRPETEQASDIARLKQRKLSGGAHRVALSVPVLIRGALGAHGTIREETHTVFVSARGAVIALVASIQAATELTLINLRNGAEAKCRVAAVEPGDGGRNHVDVEFTKPQLQFWAISFLAENSGAEAHKRPQAEPATTPAGGGNESVAAYSALKRIGSIHSSDASNATRGPSTSVAMAPLNGKQPVDMVPSAHQAPTVRQGDNLVSEFPPENLSNSILNSEQPQIQPYDPLLPTEALHIGLNERDITKWPDSDDGDEPSRGNLLLVCIFTLLVAAALIAGRMYVRLKTSPVSTHAPSNSTSQLEDALQPSASATEPHDITVTPDDELGVRTPLPTLTAASLPQPAREPEETERTPTTAPGPPPATEKVKMRLDKLPFLVVPRGKVAMPAAEPLSPPPNILAETPGSVPGGLSSGAIGVGSKLLTPRSVPKPVVGGDVKAPRLVSAVRPIYPGVARSERAQDDVVIQADIDTMGNVVLMKVLAGRTIFHQAALEALAKWKYEPARLDGQPMPAQILVTIRFRIE